jgi:Sigma-54 interaction domain
MNAAAAPQIPVLDSYQTELGILRAPAANVLIEGPASATDDVVLALRMHLREPLVSDLAHAPLHLPDGAATPMILRNVAALTADDQARLLAWLQGEGFGAQVVSTTERPLFRLVAQGLFDAALYYRLNILLLRIEATNRSRVAQRRLPRPRRPDDVVAPASSDETAIAEEAPGARADNPQG